jgi:Protein of unknown function (DUF1566)
MNNVNVIPMTIAALVLSASGAAAQGFPRWDTQINSPKRFVVLVDFGGEAVLDKETGLVWEQTPNAFTGRWHSAQSHCIRSTIGNRQGWRLPTIQELTSLVDARDPGNPDLPAGHPFNTAHPTSYWSATTWDFLVGDYAWLVRFGTANGTLAAAKGDDSVASAWCVRGGQGVNPQ